MRYRCLNRSLLRQSPEMKSKKTGQLKKGQVVEVLEQHRLENGVLRLRTPDGWGSEKSSDGTLILQVVEQEPEHAGVSRARSPSPRRPSQRLATTSSLHRGLPSVRRVLCLLLLGVLYDMGLLQDTVAVLQGGAPSSLEPADQDLYTVLDLAPTGTATTQDVHDAFRQRSKDLGGCLERCADPLGVEFCPPWGPPTLDCEEAQIAVSRAYRVLGDSERRCAYDAMRNTSTMAGKIDAITRLVVACARGEQSRFPEYWFREAFRIIGLGDGLLLWLAWLHWETPSLSRRCIDYVGYYLLAKWLLMLYGVFYVVYYDGWDNLGLWIFDASDNGSKASIAREIEYENMCSWGVASPACRPRIPGFSIIWSWFAVMTEGMLIGLFVEWMYQGVHYCTPLLRRLYIRQYVPDHEQ